MIFPQLYKIKAIIFLLILLTNLQLFSNTIKVGYYNHPPLQYFDNKKESVQGGVVEYFKELANQQNLKIEWVGPIKETNEFNDEHFDISLFNLKTSSKFNSEIMSEKPFYLLKPVLLINITNNDIDFLSIKNIRKLKTGFPPENPLVEPLDTLFKSESEYRLHLDFNVLFEKLKAKEIDAIYFSDQAIADFYLSKYDYFNDCKVFDLPTPRIPVYLGFNSKSKVAQKFKKHFDNDFSHNPLQVLSRVKFETGNIKKENQRVYLTREEKEFIKNNPIIRVQNEEDYPPFDFRVDAEAKGYSIDYLKLISKKTGLKFNFINGKSWSGILESFKKREIDIIHTCIQNEERNKYTLFTKGYGQLNEGIISRKNNPYKSLEELQGKKVAILKSSYNIDTILKFDKTINIIEANSTIELLNMVTSGEVEAGIECLPLFRYYEKELFLANLHFSDFTADQNLEDFTSNIRFGIRKDWPLLHSIIEKGMSSITGSELNNLREKWFMHLEEEKTLKLTEKEEEYLNSRSEIIVGSEKDWEPFNFNENGIPKGFSIDFMNLVALKSGLNIRFTEGQSWNQLLSSIKSDKIDILLNVAKTKEREEFLSYSKNHYLNIFIGSCTRKDLKDITKFEQLGGKTVSVEQGFLMHSYLQKNYPDTKFLIAENSLEAINHVADGQADVYFGNFATINYLINKYWIVNLRTSLIDDADFNKSTSLYIGFNKKNKYLKSIIDKGMQKISQYEINKLREKWLLKDSDRNILNLSKEEISYLRNRNDIIICIDPYWMPYERINENGDYIGISSEIVKLISKKINKNFTLFPTKTWGESFNNLKEGRCDVLPAVAYTKEREKFMNFTVPYLNVPNGIVTKNDVSFVNSIEEVLDKKFAVVKGYAVIEKLKRKYPKIEILEVENVVEGLEKVDSGKVFGYIDLIPTISYHIQSNSLLNLKIAGKLNIEYGLSIGVKKNNTMLLQIIQKALDSLTKEEIQSIVNKWVTVRYDRSIDYSLLWKISGITLIIFLFIFYWNRKLSLEIDRRIKVEESLKNAKIKAEAANKAKSEFLANMSHELRTPLNAVIGFSELLSSMMEDSKQKSYVTSIKTAGKSLLTLINDILDLSKIEAGGMEIKKKQTNIFNLIKEIENIFKIKTEKKGVEFILDIDNTIPKSLILDEVRVRQVLFNLIGNADKFTEEGYIKLSIAKKDRNDDTIDLMLSVTDTGIGIPEKDLETIFESFKQQEDHNIKKFGGTGLGLTICKKLTEAMGGKISVKSKPLKGSTFKVELEAVEISLTAENSEDLDLVAFLDTHKYQKENILVVDDIESNRVMIKEMLERLNLEVLIAENGHIALDIINDCKPKIILMDIRMPVMDGIEATQILKNDPALKNIPVVAVTASSSVENEEELLKKGFDAYLEKPFKVKDLLDILSAYLKKDDKAENVRKQEIPEKNKLSDFELSENLTSLLKEELLPECESLLDIMIIGNIEEFGEKVSSAGTEYNVPYLVDFGKQLKEHAENFDTDAITYELERLKSEINLIN